MERKATVVDSGLSRKSSRKSRRTDKDINAVQSEIVSANSGRRSTKLKTKKVKSEPATSRPFLEGEAVPSVRPELIEESDISHSEDLHEVTNSPADADASYHNFITKFSTLLAEDFWETAWDICETRFLHETASQAIVSDLRDTWLSITEMQWLDNDPKTFEQAKFPAYEDSLPHPPKFDFWSHGALEPLPRTCRESVMDPFIREPMPWVLEKLEQDRQNLKSEKSSLLHVAISEDENETLEPPIALIRPTSPVPTSDEGEITESLWSIASTLGSYVNLAKLVDTRSDMVKTSSPKSTANLAYAAAEKQHSQAKSPSIELLYPSKIPRAEIRASSEIAYKTGSGLSGYMKHGDGLSNRDSEIVAFKLPRQTSIESAKAHHERKSRKPVKSCSSSENQNT